MKFDTQYKAVLLNKSSGFDDETVDELAKLSWLAMGLYQYLLLHGNHSIVQLGLNSPGTPYAQISKGLQELVELGLVQEVTSEPS